MTVAELIKHLGNFNQDLHVYVFRNPVYRNEEPAAWETVNHVVGLSGGVYLYFNRPTFDKKEGEPMSPA